MHVHRLDEMKMFNENSNQKRTFFIKMYLPILYSISNYTFIRKHTIKICILI